MGAVLRPSPRPPQEQLYAQACFQDHDRDLAGEATQTHRDQVRQSGQHAGLLRRHRPSQLVRRGAKGIKIATSAATIKYFFLQ